MAVIGNFLLYGMLSLILILFIGHLTLFNSRDESPLKKIPSKDMSHNTRLFCRLIFWSHNVSNSFYSSITTVTFWAHIYGHNTAHTACTWMGTRNMFVGRSFRQWLLQGPRTKEIGVYSSFQESFHTLSNSIGDVMWTDESSWLDDAEGWNGQSSVWLCTEQIISCQLFFTFTYHHEKCCYSDPENGKLKSGEWEMEYSMYYFMKCEAEGGISIKSPLHTTSTSFLILYTFRYHTMHELLNITLC
jgi:hypothetical protein